MSEFRPGTWRPRKVQVCWGNYSKVGEGSSKSKWRRRYYALDQLGHILLCQGLYLKAEKIHRRTLESLINRLGYEHLHTSQHGSFDFDIFGARTMEGGRRAGSASNRDKKESIRAGTSRYIGQHGWSSDDTLRARKMEGGWRTRSASNRDKKENMGSRASMLNSMANLAVTFWEQGRWKESEELEMQVIEIRKRVLGQEHPHTRQHE